MILIELITARQILNSRGEPTIEVEVTLSNTVKARASVPSGKSKSSHEAVELLDKDYSKYFSRSVEHAVNNINEIIAPRLKKQDPLSQAKIDQILLELDGTPNKAHLGANATLAVSIAVARSAALMSEKPLFEHINELFIKVEAQNRFEETITLPKDQMKVKLPLPAFNLINGGQHADTSLPIQEYLIFPVGIETMANKIRAAAEINHELGNLLHDAGKPRNIGDEGGYACNFDDVYEPIDFLIKAVEKAGYRVHNKVLYGFDIAGASTKDGLPEDFFETVFNKYPIISVEDPYDEEDWEDFRQLNERYPDIFVVGDDITATNPQRLRTAIENNSIDCVIVKPNQIGTVTETLEFAKIAREANIALFVSHRSGETNDSFVVDLAVGVGAKFLKAGAPVRGERVAKYNRLLEIAEHFEG